MPNQPAKDGATILIRLPRVMKEAVQSQVERLNAANPGAGYTVSSWVRGLIETDLARSKKGNKKKQ